MGTCYRQKTKDGSEKIGQWRCVWSVSRHEMMMLLLQIDHCCKNLEKVKNRRERKRTTWKKENLTVLCTAQQNNIKYERTWKISLASFSSFFATLLCVWRLIEKAKQKTTKVTTRSLAHCCFLVAVVVEEKKRMVESAAFLVWRERKIENGKLGKDEAKNEVREKLEVLVSQVMGMNPPVPAAALPIPLKSGQFKGC